MSELVLQTKPFLSVRERHFMLLEKHHQNLPSSSSSAVGTAGIVYCVGMYCEPNDTKCFVWHAYGQPMTLTGKGMLLPGSPNFKKISACFREWLEKTLGVATAAVRDTLVLATSWFNDQNWAIIDGILDRAGVEDKARWIQSRLRCASAFIVEEPGNVDSVRYFPPGFAMASSHPGHLCRDWHAVNWGSATLDQIETVEPSEESGGA